MSVPEGLSEAVVEAEVEGPGRDGVRRAFGRDVAVVLPAVIAHPSVWWAAIAAVTRLSRRGWWWRPPFLPVPGEAYWAFRLVTAFGGTAETAVMRGDDVVAYLQWCRRTRPRRG